MQEYSYIFFGTGPLAESVLASLVRGGNIPTLIITKPDSRQGRHMEITKPYLKLWAELKGIPVYQPETLKDLPTTSILFEKTIDLFIVASYGKILPEKVLSFPTYGTLNIHPSLLPKLRGPSPIESTLLLGEKYLGLSIMKLDKEMDHGPLLLQSTLPIEQVDTTLTLEVKAGMLGGELLQQVIPHFLEGTLKLQEQKHDEATFCHMITKEMGEITLTDSSQKLLTYWRALTPWPGVYFYHTHKEKRIRVKITNIQIEKINEGVDVSHCIKTVIPEGKKEISFLDFKRGYNM